MNPEWIHIGIALVGTGFTIFVAYIMQQVKNQQLQTDLRTEKYNAEVKAELVASTSKIATELDVHKTEDAGNFREVNAGIARIERRMDARAG